MFGHECGCGRHLGTGGGGRSPPWDTSSSRVPQGEKRGGEMRTRISISPAKSNDPRAQVPSGTAARCSARAARGRRARCARLNPAAEAGRSAHRDSGHRPRGPARGPTTPALLLRVPRGRDFWGDPLCCFQRRAFLRNVHSLGGAGPSLVSEAPPNRPT